MNTTNQIQISPTKLFQAYDEMATLIISDEMKLKFNPIQTMFDSKRANPEVKIMVYGVYNAGKSTLINALIGQEVARMADVPETDKVSTYDWQEFRIMDTPGVDAPIEHENITEEQLLKVDGVVFVVNSVGVVEEEKTLAKLMDILASGKKVFLVMNEKNELTDEDFIKLKDQTHQLLQSMAVERGLKNVLKDIPITRVNARSALKGRVENKQGLVAKSGITRLESELHTFANEITPADTYIRLKSDLETFTATYLDFLQDKSQESIVKKYDAMLTNIEMHKVQTRKQLRDEVSDRSQRVGKLINSKIRSTPETIEEYVQQIFEVQSTEIADILTDELALFNQQVTYELDKFQTELPTVESASGNFTTVDTKIDGVEPLTYATHSPQAKIDPAELTKQLSNLAQMAKPEHLVTAMKLMKDAFPALMKGIGPKTMEKIAGNILAKVPYIGFVVTGVLAMLNIYGDSKEANLLQKQIDEANEARERYEQQINETVSDIQYQFETEIGKNIKQAIDTYFAQVSDFVRNLREGFSQQEQENSTLIQKVSSVDMTIRSL